MTAHGCFGSPGLTTFGSVQRRLLARPGEVSWQVAQRRLVEAGQQVTQPAIDRKWRMVCLFGTTAGGSCPRVYEKLPRSSAVRHLPCTYVHLQSMDK